MRTLPPGLAAHLASGATTLCWCWRLTPRAGERLGFTDHDRDIAFDGTLFEAATGFTASEIRDSVGLSVDNLEVESALASGRLSEQALAGGDFDDARVEIFRVNWADPGQRVLMRQGSIGEVRRSGAAFTAEVRGLAHYLQQPQGRVFQYACDAELGDTRCGIDLASATYRAEAAASASSTARVVTAADLGGYIDGWFTRGLLAFTSGVNAGRACEVKRHQAGSADSHTFELWQPLPIAPASGDTFVVTAGCDKHIDTCRTRFGNVVRYRGFPDMPGNDALAAGAQAEITSPIAP